MIHGLPKTAYSGGSPTQPKYDARPTRATVAYRLTPAASENANVRPSTAKVSICVVLRLDRKKCFDVLSVVRRDRSTRKTWGGVLESEQGHAFRAETSQAAAAAGHLAVSVRAGAGADASGCRTARDGPAAAGRLTSHAGRLAARRRSARARVGLRPDRRSASGRPLTPTAILDLVAAGHGGLRTWINVSGRFVEHSPPHAILRHHTAPGFTTAHRASHIEDAVVSAERLALVGGAAPVPFLEARSQVRPACSPSLSSRPLDAGASRAPPLSARS